MKPPMPPDVVEGMVAALLDAQKSCVVFATSKPNEPAFVSNLVRALTCLSQVLQFYFQEIKPLEDGEKNGENNC